MKKMVLTAVAAGALLCGGGLVAWKFAGGDSAVVSMAIQGQVAALKGSVVSGRKLDWASSEPMPGGILLHDVTMSGGAGGDLRIGNLAATMANGGLRLELRDFGSGNPSGSDNPLRLSAAEIVIGNIPVSAVSTLGTGGDVPAAKALGAVSGTTLALREARLAGLDNAQAVSLSVGTAQAVVRNGRLEDIRADGLALEGGHGQPVTAASYAQDGLSLEALMAATPEARAAALRDGMGVRHAEVHGVTMAQGKIAAITYNWIADGSADIVAGPIIAAAPPEVAAMFGGKAPEVRELAIRVRPSAIGIQVDAPGALAFDVLGSYAGDLSVPASIVPRRADLKVADKGILDAIARPPGAPTREESAMRAGMFIPGVLAGAGVEDQANTVARFQEFIIGKIPEFGLGVEFRGDLKSGLKPGDIVLVAPGPTAIR